MHFSIQKCQFILISVAQSQLGLDFFRLEREAACASCPTVRALVGMEVTQVLSLVPENPWQVCLVFVKTLQRFSSCLSGTEASSKTWTYFTEQNSCFLQPSLLPSSLLPM